MTDAENQLKRLVLAVKENQDALQAIKEETFNGNYGPPKPLNYGHPLVKRLRDSYMELNQAMNDGALLVGIQW